MAISDFDELSKIEKAETESKGSKITSFADWYGEMDLPQEEKEEREELAEKFLLLFLFYFLMVQMDAESDYKDLLEESYVSIANSFTGENTASAYVTDRASEVAQFVDEITRKHLGDEYFTSRDRGMVLSANEGNVLGNYREFVRAVKAGKKFKVWHSEIDRKTRKTHRPLNNKRIGIFELFQVGKYKMRFPMDTTLGAGVEEVANCRCTVSYE